MIVECNEMIIIFAKTGNPNDADLPLWSQFEESLRTTMRLGAQTGMMPIAAPERIAFWTEVLTAPTETASPTP